MTDRSMRPPRAWLLPVTAAALAVLTACSTQQDLQPSLRALDTQRMGVQPASPAEVSESLQPWWQAYGDAQLSALIERALADSPTVQVAQARLGRAQASEAFTRGSDRPQVQASAEVDRQHFSRHGMYPPPIAGASLTSGTLQFEGSWELDLFGRQRAELEAAVGHKRAAQADVQAARLLLSSQVARTYLQLGRLQAQREVGVRTLAQREDMLKLIRQRVQAGLDTAVELKQGEGALPEARVQIEVLDEQILLTRHALAVLTGQQPDALDGLQVRIGALQPVPAPARIPMDLLARRADVMAALWRVEAAGHQVDAARALFYPNVDLVSYAGYNAIGLDQLLKPGSLQWGLMPAIHLPLFDGHRRRANLQGKVIEQDAAQASYNQTVLQAVQEAADQIASGQSVQRQRREQQAAQQSAEAAYQLARERYQAGLGSYLVVLSAESAVLAQRRSAVDLQARAVDAQIALVRALGGSLEAAQAAAPLASHSSDKQPAAAPAGDRS